MNLRANYGSAKLIETDVDFQSGGNTPGRMSR